MPLLASLCHVALSQLVLAFVASSIEISAATYKSTKGISLEDFESNLIEDVSSSTYMQVAKCGSICKVTLNCGLFAIVGNACRMAQASSMTNDGSGYMKNVFVNKAEAYKLTATTISVPTTTTSILITTITSTTETTAPPPPTTEITITVTTTAAIVTTTTTSTITTSASSSTTSVMTTSTSTSSAECPWLENTDVVTGNGASQNNGPRGATKEECIQACTEFDNGANGVTWYELGGACFCNIAATETKTNAGSIFRFFNC